MSEIVRYRALTLERGGVDSTARTVQASLSSELPYQRDGGLEILNHDASAIDLSRAADGLPLLFGHDRMQPLGVVDNVHIEGRRLVGTLRFGESAKAAEVFRDVQNGTLRNVSVGYRVHESESSADGWRVTKWTPFEASIVSVPADQTVGINRSLNSTGDLAQMETATRDTEIREAVAAGGFEPSYAQELITRDLTADQARREILNSLAARSAADQMRERGPAPGGTMADPDFRVRAMSEAMAHRVIGGELSDPAREFVGARLSDLARNLLEMRGVRTRGMSQSALFERAMHGTSDFSNLLLGTGERVLRKGYSSYSGGLKRCARETSARDFRPLQSLALSEAPALEKVNEHGEFKRGTMSEAKESYSLGTFGKIFALTRQAMVNDDLAAFGELGGKFGRSAAEYEAGALVDLLASNPTMADTVALFDATTHKNYTSTGTAISVASLAIGAKALRTQKGLDGVTPIDATPKFLIVPAALESVALQYLSQITPNTSSAVNPYAGQLELVVDPRLDAKSATAWYLSASPETIAGLEYAYLEGQRGPHIETRAGFDVDGFEMKCRLDFGAGFVDWRGWYKNVGA